MNMASSKPLELEATKVINYKRTITAPALQDVLKGQTGHVKMSACTANRPKL